MLFSPMKKTFDSIESVVADVRKGKMVIVVDDADRENEGDLIMAGQFVTPAAVNFMAKFGRGLICVPAAAERLHQLGIDRMVQQNRESFRTDFHVSVDAARGITTGISAADRARTIKILAEPAAVPDDLVQPGTCFRCARVRAASSNAPATPRRRWTWPRSQPAGPSASSVKS